MSIDRKRKKCAAQRIEPTVKKAFYERVNRKCQYCGQKKSCGELSLDHVFPVSKYKCFDKQWNLVVACKKCNVKKDNSFPSGEIINQIYRRKVQYELLDLTINKFFQLKRQQGKSSLKHLRALKAIHITLQEKYYGKVLFDGYGKGI